MKRNVIWAGGIVFVITAFMFVGCGSSGGDGGGNPTTQLTVHTAFVTSVSGTGNLSTWSDANGTTGLAAADAVCQARAEAAGQSGSYVAWLSDSSDDAYCRIHGLTGTKASNCNGLLDPAKPAGPWVRTDGAPFAPAADALIANQSTYTPARFDEYGTEQMLHFRYFTATGGDGTYSGASCGDWTDGTAGSASMGYFQATGFRWTATGLSPCSNSLKLLCMETGPGAELGAFAQSGKKVFVSSEYGTGDFSTWVSAGSNTGTAAADQVCRTLAGTAGLTNHTTFKAWVSTSTTSAPDRFASNGPWVRLDGVKVADNKADLLDQSLFAPINLDENGAYVTTVGRVWTGTTNTGSSAADSCTNWSDGTAGVNGAVGEIFDARLYWTQLYYTVSCDKSLRLYCFEN